jgi:predicted RNase H-like HicB family nuclease
MFENKYNQVLIEGEVPFSIIKSEFGYTAISYPLNLATQGETLEEAKLMFDEALYILLEDLIENNILEETMLEAGFRVEIQNQNSPIKIIIPPETQTVTAKFKLPHLA